MGRKVPLELQKGDLTDKVKKQKELEEASVFVGNEQLEKPPEWLINDKAIEEWKRLVKEFNKKSLISNLDYNNLGAYCNSFAKYTEVVNKMGMNLMIGKTTNPLITLELKYSDEMKRYGSLLGLTSESRLKLGGIKAGEQNQEVSNSFGDI
ncbi:MAG: phage terminase small subunit P27 family [Fusobacteriaceae bacterium]